MRRSLCHSERAPLGDDEARSLYSDSAREFDQALSTSTPKVARLAIEVAL